MRLHPIKSTAALTAGRVLLGGLLGGLVMTSTATFAEDSASRKSQSTRKQTAASDFDRLHRMVLPQDNELKWVSLPWLTSITQARHQAAVEGKPLFVFADTGAGFADALGLC